MSTYMDAHEMSERNQEPTRFNWIVTNPSGKSWEVWASEWFVRTYYSVPGWSYIIKE